MDALKNIMQRTSSGNAVAAPEPVRRAMTDPETVRGRPARVLPQ